MNSLFYKAIIALFFSFVSMVALNRDFILPVGSTEVGLFRIDFDGSNIRLHEKPSCYNAVFSDKPFVEYSNFEFGPYLIANKLVFLRRESRCNSLFICSLEGKFLCTIYNLVREGSARICDDGKRIEFGFIGQVKTTIVDLCK